MNGLQLQYMKGLENSEQLCIVDQDHQWRVIAVDYASKFKAI